MVIVRRVGRIFQFQAFVADVPEVPVTAVALGMVKRQIDAFALAVRDFVFAGLEFPDIRHSPGSDNLQVRSQRLDAQLKTDLVISLSGRAVADRRSAFLPGDFNQLFRDRRPGHGGTEQILVLIHCPCLYAWHNIVLGKVIIDILNIELRRAGQTRSFFQTVQFVSLSAVNAAADDFVTEMLLQPGNDRCRVKTSRICENYFFVCHDSASFELLTFSKYPCTIQHMHLLCKPKLIILVSFMILCIFMHKCAYFMNNHFAIHSLHSLVFYLLY